MTGMFLALLGGKVQIVTDPYFEYTTLLLPGNGTNGAQNNTFLDASTNNFTITRNGNTTQGTFSPFSQTGWGNYFDGSGDSLTVPSGSSVSGTGNFTVEFFIYPSTIASGYKVVYINETSGGFAVLLNSTGTLSYGRALVAVDGTTTGTVTFNQWNHVAFVRSGTGANQFVCYINGSSAGSFTNSTSYASGIVRIGTDSGGVSFPFDGYLSNVRSATVAVYTGAFTVPTSPLTATQSAGTNISAITGTQTSLLTCQSNRFIDNSTNNFTITRNGDTRVVAFSPFNPTSSWSATTNGGSGYFDGSGDYLSVADNAALELGSSNFTIEFWYYPTSFVDATTLVTKGWSSSQRASWMVYNNGTAGIITFYGSSAGTSYDIAGGTQIGTAVLNAWNHVAISRSGSTIGLFLNGVRGNTVTSSASFWDVSTALTISADSTGAAAAKGYMSSLRMVVGTAVYDPTQTTLTVPTAPLTNITNTSLLLNFTNAGIYDATSKNDLETVGNAQISTTQSKWGGSSMSFDGTTDYLVEPTSVYFGYGTGDFTIEFWLYLNGAGVQTVFSNLSGTASTNPHIYINSTTLIYYTAGATAITGASLSTGVWYHIALCRASGSTRMFINGTQTGSTYADTNNYGQSAPLGVGTYWNGGAPVSASTLNGYLQDVRVTKYARYTANFTAPTAAFPTL